MAVSRFQFSIQMVLHSLNKQRIWRYELVTVTDYNATPDEWSDKHLISSI
jgi:hypothetical protein